MLRATDRPITVSRNVEIGLRILGIWPGIPYQNLPRLIWTTSMLWFQTFQYHYLVAYYKTESLSNLVDNLSTTVPCSNAWFKLTAFCVNESLFRDVLASMNRGCQIAGSIDSNSLISKTANLGHRLTTAVLLIYPMCGVVYSVGVLLSEERFEQQDGQPRRLFFLMKLPFETNESRVFNTVMLVQFFHVLAFGVSTGLITALLLTLILHVGCQADILCQRLMEICYDNTKQLRYLIGLHQEIISLTENIAKLFNHIALMQFISSTLCICCIGFLIVISIGTENVSSTLTKCAMFYVTVATESFLFCFAGEYLSTKSRRIGHAAYKSLWYDLCPAECRVVLLLIMRSQKELTITIGKISNLSLSSFATILKASASYISVLLAMR